MTNDELWSLVEQIRRIRNLADDADAVLYGIFGISSYDPNRAYRIKKALKLLEDMKDLLGLNVVECGSQAVLTHDETGKKLGMVVDVVCRKPINHEGQHYNGLSSWD